MIPAASSPVPRLLAGPPLDGTAERWAAHLARLGDVPADLAAAGVIDEIEAAGLLGRGGAAFPVGRKWRAIADRRDGAAVVVANGAEGEPASWKDRVLMAHRPHLVIDGAVLAARAIGADEVVLYVGEEHEAAGTALRRALLERRDEARPPIRIEAAPQGYVSGEATAAVHRLNGGDALPTMTPPRVSQAGVGGRPTLVQNVETLAYAALIARRGAAWYRAAGRGRTPGTTLVTVGGAVEAREVREIELGIPVGELAVQARVEGDVQAVLLGGYGGAWVAADEAWDLPLDPSELRARGATLGCGVVQFLPARACGVTATAGLVAYLADERAGQCGPCEFGLPAIAAALGRVASGASRDPLQDLQDVERWSAMIAGRGACHHPDGAVLLVTTAFEVFRRELEAHARLGRCSLPEVRSHVA